MSDFAFEEILLSRLLQSKTTFQKIFPHLDDFLKGSYFENHHNLIIWEEMKAFCVKHDAFPNKVAIEVSVDNRKNLTEDQFKEVKERITRLYSYSEEIDEDWLYSEAEKWLQSRAFFHVVLESAEAIQKGDTHAMNASPELMQEALNISFEDDLGHEYLEMAERRWEFYNDPTEKIPFKLRTFNTITNGGVRTKTLNVFLSNQTGGFKSGTMCDFAAWFLQSGHDVVYFTMEMSEEEIARRIDANLMQIDMDDVSSMPKELYLNKSKRVREKCAGRLMVKEYPTSCAHAGHLSHYLKEIRNKKGFKPKVVFVDYLNICASQRVKNDGGNSYHFVKAVAEELRALACRYEFACFSATQANRGPIGSSDINLSDTSESIGLPSTCDLYIGIITTEDLDEMNQLKYKQLKNRYSRIDMPRSFEVGVSKSKMTLYDLDFSIDQKKEPGVGIVLNSGSDKDFSGFNF